MAAEILTVPILTSGRTGVQVWRLRPHRHIGAVLRTQFFHNLSHVDFYRIFNMFNSHACVRYDLVRLALLDRSHDRGFGHRRG